MSHPLSDEQKLPKAEALTLGLLQSPVLCLKRIYAQNLFIDWMIVFYI